MLISYTWKLMQADVDYHFNPRGKNCLSEPISACNNKHHKCVCALYTYIYIYITSTSTSSDAYNVHLHLHPHLPLHLHIYIYI